MSGCERCGRRCIGRLCRDCEADKRASERAEHRRDKHPECPTCGGRTSGEGVECYQCRSDAERVETDGGREECPRCGYLLGNTEAPCPYCGTDPDEADDGDVLRSDGGSIRGLDAGDDIERHLQGVLEHADDQEARRHAREALQHTDRLEPEGRR